MLTKDILKANEALAGLTDEQIAAITTLSQNDENSVIAKKTGEIYGALDADILNVSGIAKNGTEKTYDYAKRVLGELKGKAAGNDDLNKQIASLTSEKAKLEKAIAENATDAEAAKALKQAKADLASITSQYNDLNTKYNEDKAKHEKAIFDLKIDNALQLASKGLRFKAGLPEAVTRVILQQATDKIKGMHPELIDDGNGGKTLAFKDKDGAIMRNPNNQLNPFTANELLSKELDTMGVLDKGTNVPGGGTNAPNNANGGANAPVIDVAGAKTRVEAYDMINKMLLSQGMTVGSDAYAKAMDQAWKDNNIAALPEK